MPHLNEEKLAKLLKSPDCGNIFMIFGNDGFLKEFYCNKITDNTVSKDLRFFNLHIFNDLDSSLEEIFEAAEALPVMSEKTCVLVRNYPLNTLKEKELEYFTSALSGVPESTVVIFYYNTIDITLNYKKKGKWDSIADIFAKYGTAAEISHRTPERNARLLVSKAKDRGTSIDEAEALYLINSVGGDMNNLLNEFNKVCAYSCGQKITKEMIDTCAVKSIEASVFDISASVFNGKPDRAFAILNELIRLKTSAVSIVGALSSAYVNIYRYKLALNSGTSYSDFSNDFGYPANPSYTFRGIADFTKKSRLSDIKEAINILAEANVACKSSSVDNNILLLQLLARLISLTEVH